MVIFRQLRYQLQVRRVAVFRASARAVLDELRLFFHFLTEHALLNGILQELRTNLPDFDQCYSKTVHNGRIYWPPTEEDRVRVCLSVLEHYVELGKEQEIYNIALNAGARGRTIDEAAEYFLTQFFLPFYEYLDQHIEEYGSVLYVIEKFKLRSQWFDRRRLYESYERDTSRGEKTLDERLRKFLFDNGIEYPFSTPASSSGRADIVASLHTADPVIIEVKVFDVPGRGRDHIRGGVRQVHDYMVDYNKNVGYLVIFNVCDKDLQFQLTSNERPPRIHLDDKTIFLVVVDIFHDITPASERPQLEVYEIGEEYLVRSVDPNNALRRIDSTPETAPTASA